MKIWILTVASHSSDPFIHEKQAMLHYAALLNSSPFLHSGIRKISGNRRRFQAQFCFAQYYSSIVIDSIQR